MKVMESTVRPVKLLGDIILVREDARELAPAGLIVPAAAHAIDDARRHELVRTGTVLEAGPGKRHPKTGARMAMHVQPGDRVSFTDWVGAPRPDVPARPAWEARLVFMHESEVLAVL
jgi:co-chaperonin GroES (HSP10)